MEDIARIGFKAETAQLVDAKKKLDELGPAANRAENASDKLAKKMGWAKDAQGKWRDEMGKFVPKARLAEAGLANLEKRIGLFDRAVTLAKGNFAGFAAGFAGAFGLTAATFGISALIGTLSEFEYQMSTVAAVSGATGAELQALRDTAKDLGATTEFSATQAAGGLKLLVQAGYSAKDAIATLPAVLNLATTEAMDLGVATEYVNSIMAGFGLGVQDAARVTDVLVYASNAASTGVAELGEGMKFVGPISAALGISIEDTAAALGLLSDAGLKGGQAGTSLRSSLAALASPTKMAVDELTRMGVAARDVNPATNSIVTIVNRLADANLDAAGAFKIFGREAAPAVLGLIANKEKLATLTDEMQNVSGEAQRIADYMRDNLKGSLQGLGSVIEAVVIAMGDAGLTAVLRAVMDGLTFLLGGVVMLINAFGSLISMIATPVFEFVAEHANTLKAAVIGVSVALVASYIPAMYAAISSGVAWVATAFIINGGFVGMTAAIYTAVAGLVTLRGALIMTGFGAIAVLVGMVVKYILDLADKVGGLGNAFTLLGQLAGDVWRGMGESAKAIPPVLKGVWDLIRADFLGLIAMLQNDWISFIAMMQGGLAAVGLFSDTLFDIQSSAATALIETEDAIEGATKSASDNFAKAGTIISDAFKPAKDRLAELNAATEGMGDAADTTVPKIIDLNDNTNDLGDSAGGAAGKVKELKTELQMLTDEFNKMGEPFEQASAAFSALDSLKENGIIGNDEFVSSLGRIEEAFLRAGGSAEQWAAIIGEKTKTVAEQLDDLGKKNLNDLGGAFIDLAVDGKASFADLTKSIIKDLLAIAWQALVVKPLLNFMGIPMAAKGAVAAPGGAEFFAKGGAFTNDVVSRPTAFKFAQGGGFGLGVMGEAGPEAVMPLSRGPDGSLGVQMYGAGGSGAGRGGAPQDMRLTLHVTAEEGDLFRPTIRAEAEGVAIAVAEQTAAEMNAQLPGRVNEILDDPKVR